MFKYNWCSSMVRMAVLAVLTLSVYGGGYGPPPDVNPESLPAFRVKADTRAVLFRNGLAISGVSNYGRAPIHRDLVERRIVEGTWQEPAAGQTLAGLDGQELQWREIFVDDAGWFEDKSLRGGYLYSSLPSDVERSMILHTMGNVMVYVNGEPRIGNRYQTLDKSESWEPSFDMVRLPVRLRRGENKFLFMCGRGRLKAELLAADSSLMLDGHDCTLPDLVAGEPLRAPGGVLVLNTGEEAVSDLLISAGVGGEKAIITAAGTIGPLSVRKVPFDLEASARQAPGEVMLRLQLIRRRTAGDEVLSSLAVPLKIAGRGDVYRQTFISSIDGSAQYFAVNPAKKNEDGAISPALVISTHGARVEALNQAGSYASKSWCTIVAPTNRRPYGYDWEDWGRLDVLEVLDRARDLVQPADGRIYLTGHSMGGHGAWILGSLFPDRFAAIGPSAGWLSFQTYRGAEGPDYSDPMAEIMSRADLAGDTLSLMENLDDTGVYILHGDADDNVPPGESRTAVRRLEQLHKDWIYHEQPGQGHWWDLSDEPGTDCVDWAPLFDFFSRHTLPLQNSVRQVRFRTPNPGISNGRHWARIEAQLHPLLMSEIDLRWDPGRERFSGSTRNVARLGFSVPPGPTTVQMELDGIRLVDIPVPLEKREIIVALADGMWRTVPGGDSSGKGILRNGPFKDAFRNRMILVYGTAGTDEENHWALAKARFDAEQFWYQGNGSVEIIPDTDFGRYRADADRGVIVYGNSRSNAVWADLLGDSPVQVNRGGIAVGERTIPGDDLACIFLRPRPGSHVASVGVVSGTGPVGMRLADRLQYLFAGCNYPDLMIIEPSALTQGLAGVQVAGFFGNDWSVKRGEFIWRGEKRESGYSDKETGRPLTPTVARDPRPFQAPREYICQRALDPVVVDGRLDETSWALASWSEPHLDIEGGAAPEPELLTRVKMIWDDEFLYVAALMEEPHVWASITERNAVIFNDNDFEVFIDPDGDGHEYYEFEMNALNTVWNLFLEKPYKNGGDAVIREMPGQVSGVWIKGTLNDPSDKDDCWTVEIAFPWSGMAEYAHGTCPPAGGEQWRLNFSRVEWGYEIRDGKYVRRPWPAARPRASQEANWVWSPQGVINMHRPETWGVVRFSSYPAGHDEALAPDPLARARYLAWQVHYALKEYRAVNEGYTDNMAELQVGPLNHPGLVRPVEITLNESGFVVTAEVILSDGSRKRVRVNQDARMWVEDVDRVR